MSRNYSLFYTIWSLLLVRIVFFIYGGLFLLFAQENALAQEIPKIVFDDTIENWIIDRFAGNTKVGASIFYQGAAREVGGIRRPELVCATPDGIYIASHEEAADNPNLYIVKNNMLRIVMDREGAIEGPIEMTQGGFPIWNTYDNTLYLTGPYCIRKVVIDQDGFRRVEVVAGTPNVPGSSDGPALSATFQWGRGWAAAQDGTIYWLETKALRKFANGVVSTVPLVRPETPGWLWNIPEGSHLLSSGEDANTLYISNYYDTSYGYSILKIDLTTNTVERIIGVDKDNPNAYNETDGPAITHAAFSGGARGVYTPTYNAILLDGADQTRYRWWKLDGDGWVRTIFGTLRPETIVKPFGIAELNSLGMEGEQFRIDASNIIGFKGYDTNGGVYISGAKELSGIWRAYDNTIGNSVTPVRTSQEGGNSKILITFINSSGQQLNTPIEITTKSTGVQAHPKVSYYNGVYMVVWNELRNGEQVDVLGVRISSDGKILDSSPLQIGTGPRTQTMPDITADDLGFMVVWHGFQESELFPKIYAARVDVDGTIGTATIIAEGASPQISWNDYEKKHIVVYHSTWNKDIRPTSNWLIMDSAKNVFPASVPYPWVYNGRDIVHHSVCAIPQASQGWAFVTDREAGNRWNRSVGIQRVINVVPDGSVAEDSPITNLPWLESENVTYELGGGAANWLDFSYESIGQWPYGANAAYPDGQYCIAVWSRYHIGGMSGYSLSNSDLYVSRVNRWDPVETSPVTVANEYVSERNPALAGNGNGSMVLIYEKLVDGAPQIVARPLKITSQINVGNEIPIMNSRGIQRGFPDIAFGESDTYLVTWQEGWYGENFSNSTFYPSTTNITYPMVYIIAPTSSSTVSGSVTVSANASVDAGVAGVQFKLDGNELGSEDTIAPYSITWDTTETLNGTYNIYAVARDFSNNHTISNPITVTVNNTYTYSTSFNSGDRVQVNIGDGSETNIKRTPSISALLLGTQSQKALGTIISGGISADGYYWWYVDFDSGDDGYIEEDFITKSISNESDTSSLIQDGGMTPEQISVFLPGEFSTTTTATMRYRIEGTNSWINGHDLLRIYPEYSTSDLVDEGFAWSIIDLSPGTAYEIEVTLHEGNETNKYTANMYTRSLPSVAGSPTKTIAAGTNIAQIQAVLDSALPGDVIQFSNGTYTVDDLKVRNSGTLEQPIYIRGERRESVILEDSTDYIIKLDKVSNIIIENMTLRGSGLDAGISPKSTGVLFWGDWNNMPPKENITIRNLSIVGVDRGIDVSNNGQYAKQMLVYDNNLIGNNKWNQDLYKYSGSGIPGGGDGTPDLDQNIFWNDDGIRLTGQGNAAFNNTISGFGDAMALENGFKSVGTHFYRNDIIMSGDDAIEIDYATRNVTIYDNRVQNSMTLASFDPIWGGPVIVARNIGINIGRQPYKMNNTNSGHFIYNNTVVIGENKYQWGWVQFDNGFQRNWGYQNNILIYKGSGNTLAMEPPQELIDFTHNSWYPNKSVWWTHSGGSYQNLYSAYTSLDTSIPVFSNSTQRHEADNISEPDPFITPITIGNDYHAQIITPYIPILSSNTAPKNSGTPITGITDGFSGPSPDRGAIISGRPIPIIGDRGYSVLTLAPPTGLHIYNGSNN